MRRQPEWVQKCIIIYSGKKAQAEEATHEQSMKKYGESFLKHFQEKVERQRRISWDRFAKSREHLTKIGTDDCFMTEAGVDRGLAGKREAQVREILKTKFKCWEEGAEWNQKFRSNGDEYSDDGSTNSEILQRKAAETWLNGYSRQNCLAKRASALVQKQDQWF